MGSYNQKWFIISYSNCQVQLKGEFYLNGDYQSQTQKQFSIKSSEEFKIFSRNVKVFSNDVYIDEVLESENFLNGDRNSFDQPSRQLNIDSPQQNESISKASVLTLENQIIQLIKNQIAEDNKEKRHSVNIINNNQNQALKILNQEQPQQLIYQYNCIYFPSKEKSQIKKFSIKLSIFQQQSQYNCCIVFEEETCDQKIKRLQKICQKQQNNFMTQCLYIWTKLKATIDKQSNNNIVKQYIKLALNQINNIKTHMQQIKRQTIFSRNELNKETFLKEIVDNITQTFYKFKDQLIFDFSNCSCQTHLCQNIPRICQILTNLIENSLKQQLYQTNSLDSQSVQEQTIQFNTQCVIDSTQSQYTHQNIKCNLTQFQINKNELSCIDFSDSYRALAITQSERNSKRLSKHDILISPRIRKNAMKIKFDLIEGENELSNIIKITVKDSNETAKLSDLQNLLLQITNKMQNSDYYKEFRHLGWKVSLNIIGKLGPFYDIFIDLSSKSGINIHFYIYQNLNILNENKRDAFFSNKNFDLKYQKSNQYCYSTQRKTLHQKKDQPVSMSNISISFNDNLNNNQKNQDHPAEEMNDDDLSTLPQIVIDEQVQPVHKGYIYQIDLFLIVLETNDLKSENGIQLPFKISYQYYQTIKKIF